jgi:hypothetical protein
VIFKPGLIEKILSGKKTQTRRPVTDRDTLACPFDPSRTTTKVMHAMRYVPGRDYAIKPGRTSAGVARVLIQDLRLEQLGDITPEAAVAEGFKRTDDFFAYWERLYGRVDREQWVWVSRSSSSARSARATSAAAVGTPSGRSCRSRAKRPRCPADVQDRYTDQAHDHAAQQAEINRARRERYELEQRLARAQADARLSGVDISSPLRVIERQLRRSRSASTTARPRDDVPSDA